MNKQSHDKSVKLYAKLPSVKALSYIGAVSEPDYKLIRNRIIGHCSGGIKDCVTTLLEKAGWDLKRDERNIFAPVIETFMQIPDIDLSKLQSFVNHKEQKKSFGMALSDRKIFSIYDMIFRDFHAYKAPQLIKLVDQLWGITTCVNQVGVGPGEICLTILTNAVKGARGDLVITDVGDVEVKSSFGRLGSGDNALLVPERYKSLFESRRMTIFDVRNEIGNITGKYSKNISLDNSQWTWNEAVQSFFFYDWEFSLPTIALAASYLSTQRLSYSHQSQLVKGIKELIQEYDILKSLRERVRNELVLLVLTIQLCTYQAEHKFPYLLSVNKETKDGYPIHFSNSLTLDKNLVSVYKQLRSVNRFRSNLSIDSAGTRKGVEINFV